MEEKEVEVKHGKVNCDIARIANAQVFVNLAGPEGGSMLYPWVRRKTASKAGIPVRRLEEWVRAGKVQCRIMEGESKAAARFFRTADIWRAVESLKEWRGYECGSEGEQEHEREHEQEQETKGE